MEALDAAINIIASSLHQPLIEAVAAKARPICGKAAVSFKFLHVNYPLTNKILGSDSILIFIIMTVYTLVFREKVKNS